MKSVIKAIEYEAMRQSGLLDKGETIDRETRLWDEVGEKSQRMRSKEESQDYRYFPEPDLLPVLIDEKWLSAIKILYPNSHWQENKGLLRHLNSLIMTPVSLQKKRCLLISLRDA